MIQIQNKSRESMDKTTAKIHALIVELETQLADLETHPTKCRWAFKYPSGAKGEVHRAKAILQYIKAVDAYPVPEDVDRVAPWGGTWTDRYWNELVMLIVWHWRTLLGE